MIYFWGILIAAIMVLLSAFFSGTETGIYKLSRFRMRLGLEQGYRAYKILDKLMADSQGLIFSILIGNNLVNYFATSIVTYLFLITTSTSQNAEFYATLVMVPLMFVIADLIPKNLFFYEADIIMPKVAPLIYAIHKFFTLTGAVAILKAISHTFARIFAAPSITSDAVSSGQRQHIQQIIHETREEGMLTSVQADIIERLVNIPTIELSSVMVPLGKVKMIPLATSREDLFEFFKTTPFRQVPVYKDGRDILGYIDVHRILNTQTVFTDLQQFVRPIAKLNSTASVLETLNRMRVENLEMILVCRYDRNDRPVPIGIATMKDLVEELIGELAQW